jgi:hypothetical protein
MSNSETEEQDNKLKDVVLCYQAMGVSLSDSPEQIEFTYNSLTKEYKKNLTSSDRAVREDAKNSLALIRELYDTIRGSVTYNSMAREYEKSVNRKTDVKRLRKPDVKVVMPKSNSVTCPSCYNLISKGLKTCPKCKARLYSKTEKYIRQYVTKRNIIVLSILLAIAIIVSAAVMFPDMILNLFKNLPSGNSR